MGAWLQALAPHKSQVQSMFIISDWEGRPKKVLRDYWLASLARLVNSRFMRDTVSKNKAVSN